MKLRLSLASLCVLVLCWIGAHGQGKGVDTQTKTIRDAGNSRTPAVNGANQGTGAGSGIDFGKGKARPTPLIPNPYRLTARRDVILKAVAEVMRDRKLILDDAASKPAEGILVSQPYTFIKGAVIAQSELNRFASLEARDTVGWTRGRYAIIVEVQPIDGKNSNVSVNAKIEGRTDGPTGAEWITLPSRGTAEQEFLSALIENITGSPPGQRAP